MSYLRSTFFPFGFNFDPFFFVTRLTDGLGSIVTQFKTQSHKYVVHVTIYRIIIYVLLLF